MSASPARSHPIATCGLAALGLILFYLLTAPIVQELAFKHLDFGGTTPSDGAVRLYQLAKWYTAPHNWLMSNTPIGAPLARYQNWWEHRLNP
ncbi:MAG TPA: hypothetical protein VGO11_20290 [Chthoniobacteraceae bacterium]|jgi:hypothetical protein|nr:hypothetical protein [Chthoniobacteraceae bacterium]